MRPCTFRPPVECSGRTRDFSGSLRVISTKSEPLAPRLPGVVGLYLRMAMAGVISSDVCPALADRAEQVDPVSLGEADDGALGVGPLAVAEARPAPLAGPVGGVHSGDPDGEDRLHGLPDLSLVRVRGDEEGVLAVVRQPVALLRDDRLQQDVPRVYDPPHTHARSSLSSACWLRPRKVDSACSVNTT